MKKRLTALLLTLVMVFSLFPTTALADGRGTQIGGKETVLSWRANRRSSESGLQVTVTGSGLSGKELSVDVLKDAEAELYFSAIEGAGNTLVNPMALDIKILDEGAEWQPAGQVEVAITRQGANLSDKVYHFVPLTSIEPEGYGEEEVAEPASEELTYEELASVTDGETATVTTRHFSVYVISDGGEELVTPRATYHFLSELDSDGSAEPYTFANKADDLVDYQIIKGDELLEDPGAPVVGLEKHFLGWFVVEKSGETYSFPEEGDPIDFTAAPPVKAIDEDVDVYVAPRFGQAFVVTFWDNAKGSPEDQMHIVAKKVVYLDEGETYASVRVDDVSVPAPATMSATGWTSDDYKAGEQTTYTKKQMPIWAEVTGDFNLYPTFSAGHWLRFSGGPAGSGAGYREAIFVSAETQASELANFGTIKRDGYTFAGWYYKGSEADPFDGTEAATNASGAALNAQDLLDRILAASGDLTLYAHWTGNATTYKVISWFENADDDEYSFGYTGVEGLQEFPANSGDVTDYTPTAVDGFTAQAFDQVIVNGDGSTTLNVYYKRNIYEVKFYTSASYEATNDTTGELYGRSGSYWSGYTYYPLAYFNNNWYLLTQENTGTPSTSNNTVYLAQINGSWVQVRYNNNGQWQYRTTTSGSWTILSTAPSVYYSQSSYGNSTRYKLVNSGELTDLTITAKFGADIHDQWPGAEPYGSTWYYSPDGGAYAVGITTMPLGGASYYRMPTSGEYTLVTSFMVQNVDGSNNFTEYKRTSYKNDSNGAYKTAGDYTAIEGFRVNAYSQNDANSIKAAAGGDPNAVYDSRFNRSVEIGTRYRDVTPTGSYGNYTYTLTFYYLRNQYKITFNTNLPASATAPTLPAISDIYNQANIADVQATQIAALNDNWKIGQTTVNVTGVGDQIFQGWYDNAACEGDPFSFNKTMPASDIVLYAKWSKVEYLVQIDPRGGEILPNVSEVTYTWLKYGDKLREYNIRRDYVEAPEEYTGTVYRYVNILASDDPNARADSGAYWSGNRKGFYATDEQLFSLENFVAAFPAYAGDYAQSNYELLLDHTDMTTRYMPATTNDNWAFVGWYKAEIDPETYELTDTNTRYLFDEEITGETAIYAKWRRSGLFSIQYHTENGTVSGQIEGSLVATDSSYADAAKTSIAYTPDKITSTDGERYVFVGWKLAKPHGFDANDPGSAELVGDLYEQGDEFTVDAEYADLGHYIHLVAVYEKAEFNPDTVVVTQVVFNPNFPADATGTTGAEVKTEGVPLNTKIDLAQDTFEYDTLDEDKNTVTKTGNIPHDYATAEYVQIGWNNVKADADNGVVKFKLTDVVGVDSDDPADNTLYAVWKPIYFFVFHSSTSKVVRYALKDVEDGKFDITSLVNSEEYLYGGYYSDYAGLKDSDTLKAAVAAAEDEGDAEISGYAYTGTSLSKSGARYWAKVNAYREDGRELVPEANAVYFLKEVPNIYLDTTVKWGYDWRQENAITEIFALTVVDDTCYSSFGYFAAETNLSTKYAGSFSYQNRGSDTVIKITPTDLIGQRGYIGAVDLKGYISGIDSSNPLAIHPYWITLDNVTVETAGGVFSCTGETLTQDTFTFTPAP